MHPVTPDRWDDLVALAERPGLRGGGSTLGACWCMLWRTRLGRRAANRAGMRELVESGARPGLLTYDGGWPVGWVSVGPRESFGRLLTSPQYRPRDEDQGVFSLVCFYVDPEYRGQGVATRLLEDAIEFARSQGGVALEVYPKRDVADWRARGGSRSRLGDVDDYMGRLSSYERRGFAMLREAGKRRIMRLDLRTS